MLGFFFFFKIPTASVFFVQRISAYLQKELFVFLQGNYWVIDRLLAGGYPII
jgi:hypothetical protein